MVTNTKMLSMNSSSTTKAGVEKVDAKLSGIIGTSLRFDKV
jgi:hypothetical protein